MITKKIIILCISIGLFWVACKHEPIKKTDIIKTNGGADTTKKKIPCNADTVYFTNDIAPLLVNNCAFSGCHSAKSLSTYKDIVNLGDIVAGDTNESELFKVITSTNPNKRMPPPPREALSRADLDKFAKWIMQGALNNYCDGCNANNFKFAANILPFITTNCSGCHGENNPSGGISLTNYTQIQTVANSGKLIGSLKHESSFVAMPPSGKLDDCTINMIDNWIKNGAPND